MGFSLCSFCNRKTDPHENLKPVVQPVAIHLLTYFTLQRNNHITLLSGIRYTNRICDPKYRSYTLLSGLHPSEVLQFKWTMIYIAYMCVCVCTLTRTEMG